MSDPVEPSLKVQAPAQSPARAWRWSWSNPRLRAVVWQVLIIGVVVGVVALLVANMRHNLEQRHIATGLGFLTQPAPIPIADPPIAYTASVSTYARVLLIGVLNTLKVAVVGCMLASFLGTALGIARLSPNWLLARVAGVYVEVIRDIPLLLQLLFWYMLVQTLPLPRHAFHPLPGVYFSNRGLRFPWLDWQGGLHVDWPQLQIFNFTGGAGLTPEYAALLLGLVIYTSSYIAEIVRSGLQAVPRGQWEAASALGLSRRAALRFVVLPQAVRVIIPPMTSQYLNLTKNSSLAVAIGYQDIVSVADTTLNQTGQAIEGVGIIMVVFLTISLTISALMNLFNARMALKER